MQLWRVARSNTWSCNNCGADLTVLSIVNTCCLTDIYICFCYDSVCCLGNNLKHLQKFKCKNGHKKFGKSVNVDLKDFEMWIFCGATKFILLTKNCKCYLGSFSFINGLFCSNLKAFLWCSDTKKFENEKMQKLNFSQENYFLYSLVASIKFHFWKTKFRHWQSPI
jgi:hypothetical protein